MGIQVIGGVSGAVAETGAAAAIPLHVVGKPTPYGSLGHYRIARRLVPASTTLTGTLWTFRNPTASGILLVVERVRLRAIQVGAPTAAIEDQFALRIARAYTVADATGSVSIAPAASMQELRTSTMATATAQVREANVAAGASGGTKTLDTDGIETGSAWIAAALASGLTNGPVDIFDYYPNISDGEHPAVLASDEGLYVQNLNNFGAASGIVLHLTLAWAEVTAY